MSGFDEIEDNVFDVDETINTDIKINPDYYMHLALVKAQEALANPNKDVGFPQYRQFIEHIQVIAESSGLLGEDYETTIKEYMKTDEYTKVPDNIASVRLADKKLKIILTKLFSKKVKTDPLRMWKKG